VWAVFGRDDWAEVVVLQLGDDGDVLVQQLGTERAEWSHVSRLFELRPGH
jgi:hypothetical protein